MQQVEMKDKGIMAIKLSHRIMRFALTEYDGKLRCFNPKGIVTMSDYTAATTIF